MCSSSSLEIFLDYLLAEATRGAVPLLDPTYDSILTDDEQALRCLLHTLQAETTPGIQATLAWQQIATLLERLGAVPGEVHTRANPFTMPLPPLS